VSTLRDRLLFGAIGLALAMTTKPWHLEWWKVDVLIALTVFCISELCLKSRASIFDGWLLLFISACLFGISLFFAGALGISLSDLQSSKPPWRIVRRLPDYAVASLAYGAFIVFFRHSFRKIWNDT
jgi:hypothetical protein